MFRQNNIHLKSLINKYTLFGCFLIICAHHFCSKHQASRTGMNSDASYSIYQTIQSGTLVQALIDEYLGISNKQIKNDEIIYCYTNTCKYYPGWPEYISKAEGPATSKISFVHDNKGGFWFDTNTLLLKINWDDRYYLNQIKSAWIIPSRIRFKTPIEIPVYGIANESILNNINEQIKRAKTIIEH